MSTAAIVLLLAGAAASDVSTAASWLRSPALSADGQRIAFRYRGDLWIVPAGGGVATALVTGPSYEGDPVWSPDGAHIAFASDRGGDLDVYIVEASGGEPRRLTFHTSDELPSAFSADGSHVIFSSSRHDTAVTTQFPYREFPGTYRVPVQGGAAELVLAAPAEQARPAADGKRWLYSERKGGEMPWRKHERSPATWDLWLFDSHNGRHRRLSEGNWQYRDAQWNGAGDGLIYLSEGSGSFNVWSMSLVGESTARQLTHHADHPVRSLTAARTGAICYSYDGSFYVIDSAGAASARRVDVTFDAAAIAATQIDRDYEISEFTLSPSGDALAFVARGEVFVADGRGRNAQRLTHTPSKESDVTFAPDGKAVAYASERDGLWQIYETQLARSARVAIRERRLFESRTPGWLPRYSPDGSAIAYVADGGLAIWERDSGHSRQLLPRYSGFTQVNGSGYDIQWHPSGNYLAFAFADLVRAGTKVGYISRTGGDIQTVSHNAFSNAQPRWSSTGAWLSWITDAEGMRDYAYTAGQAVFATGLNPSGESDLRALAANDGTKLLAKSRGAKPSAAVTELSAPERGASRFAVVRLSDSDNGTHTLAHDYAADGRVVFWASLAGGDIEVFRKDAGGRPRRLGSIQATELVHLQARPDGSGVLLLTAGAIHEFSARGRATQLVGPRGVTMDAAAERRAMVSHVGRFAIQVFFKPDMDRIWWQSMVARHAQFATDAVTRREFVELLNELVGELDASHTGAEANGDDPEGTQATAALGAVLEPVHDGPGLRVSFIPAGSPLLAGSQPVTVGSVLLAIDGHEVSGKEDWNQWLRGKAGKSVRLKIAQPGVGERQREVKPLSQDESWDRFYRAWVEERRERVRRASNGKLAYSHLLSMEDANYRDLYNDALGAGESKRGLVVDTRYNGGGWLHESLLPFLSGKFLFTLGYQGSTRSTHTQEAWTRPSVMLMNSANYSNGSENPRLYRELGMGRLIGQPVAGTGLGGASTMLGNGMRVRIANDACYDARGVAFEGATIDPDILVEETPEDRAAGRDPQLDAAIAELSRS